MTSTADRLLAKIRTLTGPYGTSELSDYVRELDTLLSAGNTPPEEWREGPDAPAEETLPNDPTTSAGWIRADVAHTITVDADRYRENQITLEQFADRLGWHLIIVPDPDDSDDDGFATD